MTIRRPTLQRAAVLALAMNLAGCLPAYLIADGTIRATARAASHDKTGANSKRAKQERERAAREEAVWKQARVLTSQASTAAREGDCHAVLVVEQQVLALPQIRDVEGSLYDVVFLRDPKIVQCLADRRTRELECARQPGCVLEPVTATPPAPPPPSHARCAAERDEVFERSLSEPAAQRIAMLSTLPSCPGAPGDSDRERAWTSTIAAVTEALRGNCARAIELDPQIAALDREHYARRWSRDPAIAGCLAKLVADRADRQRCLHERAVALRHAQTITDVKRRGEALHAAPRCPPPR